MTTMKKLLLMNILAWLTFPFALPINAKEFTDGFISYTILSLDDNTVSATWTKHSPEDVIIIPAKANYSGRTFDVTEVRLINDIPIYQLIISNGISKIVQYDKTVLPYLKRLDLPGSLKTIENNLFCYCPALEEVNLGEGIETLQNYCFMSSHIRRLHIPSSVKNIWGGFCCIDKLEEITVHPDNAYYHSYGNTLMEKQGRKVILGNNTFTIPDNAKSIEGNAYCMFSLGMYNTGHVNQKPIDIIVPQSVSRINNNAFFIDSIATLRIPQSTGLSSNSFWFKSVKEIITEDGESPLNSFPETKTTSLLYFDAPTDDKVVDHVYLGRDIKNGDKLFDGYSYQRFTIKNLTLGPNVTNFTEEGHRYNIGSISSLITEPEKVTVRMDIDYYTNTPLYVPVGTKERYMSAEGWKNFITIIEKEKQPTAITHTTESATNEPTYYTIDGKRMTKVPKKGIYIKNHKKYAVK